MYEYESLLLLIKQRFQTASNKSHLLHVSPHDFVTLLAFLDDI